MWRAINIQLKEVIRDNDDRVYMPVCGASLLTKDWSEIRLYLWRDYDGYVIVEAQRRSGNVVKIEKLRMYQEPPQRCREKI